MKTAPSELVTIGDGVWAVESAMVIPGGVTLPQRATIVRLPDGALLVHAPVRADERIFAAVEALGPVAHLVAPNRFHHLFLSAWLGRFPSARLAGAPGLRDKRADLRWDDVLADGAPSAWGVVDVVGIAGAPKMNEHVLFHRPTGTLLVTDLVFNLRDVRGFMARFTFGVMGVSGQLAQSRAWRFVFTKDRRAAAASVERVLAWPIRRIVPAHGAIVDGGDAHAELERALAWMRGGR
jgi:hypothetical protein